MKEFGFKGTKEDFDKAGGDITKMKSTSGKTISDLFAGGAGALSKSGSGMAQTISGNLESGVADAGIKLMERIKPILEKFIPISERLGEAIPLAVDNLLSKFDSARETLTSVVGSIREKLEPVFASISERFMPVIQAIGVALEPVKAKFMELGVQVMPLVSAIFNTVGQVVQSFVLPAFNVIGGVIQSVAVPAINAVGNIISKVLIPGFSGVTKLLNGVVIPVLKAMGSVIKTLVVPVMKTIGKVVGTLVVGAFNKVISGASLIVRAFDKIVEAVSWVVSGIKNSIRSIFGGGGSDENATGTHYFRGGRTKINERGEELIDLPRGARIYPAGVTQQMIQRDLRNNQGTTTSGGNVVNNYVTINVEGTGKNSEEVAKEVEKRFRRLAVNV